MTNKLNEDPVKMYEFVRNNIVYELYCGSRKSGKHFDFVLCNKNDSSIICAIELNDKSHQSKKRRERDEFLNFACSSAGLPLIVVKAKRNYTLDEIKALLSVYINNDLDELSTEHSSLIGNIA